MNFKNLDRVLVTAFHYWMAAGRPLKMPMGKRVTTLHLNGDIDCDLLKSGRFDLPMLNHHVNDDWVGYENRGNKPYNNHIFTHAPTDEQIKHVFDLFYQPDRRTDLSRIFGFDFIVSCFRLFKSVPNLSAGEGPQSWHRDGTPPWTARAIIYLNDVDEDGGPFEYQNESGGRTKVCGTKGTMVLFDANAVVHRAMPPLKAERYVVDLCFGPKNGLPECVIWPGLNAFPKHPGKFSLAGMKKYP